MNARNKRTSQSMVNLVSILAGSLIFLFAFFAGVQFDFTTLGYCMLILLSPVLVLFASDLKQMKKA